MNSLLYKHISETQVLALAEEFEPEKCKQVRPWGNDPEQLWPGGLGGVEGGSLGV
jgi:hypothetical protein